MIKGYTKNFKYKNELFEKPLIFKECRNNFIHQALSSRLDIRKIIAEGFKQGDKVNKIISKIKKKY